MRDHSNHIQLTREDAVAGVLAAIGPVAPELERVPVAESVGRVLARDVTAVCDMPSSLTCNMDSIALHWSDFEGLADGELPDTSGWTRGVEWQFANTGVAMPEGFETAIAIENVEVSDDEQHVTILEGPSRKFAGTSPVGSRLKRGDVLASAGTVITPDVAATIGGGDVGSVTVVRKPRVAFIPTGNELVPAGVPYDALRADSFAARGRNFETNGILVRGKVEAWGGVYVPFDIVVDERDAIREAIELACETADIVVLNAGSSKGSDDWSCEVLEEMGQVICHQTNHGPGHHSSYAVVNGTPIVGISGPSGGASFTLDFYLRPVMRTYQGLDPDVPKTPARLVEPFPAGGHGPGGKGGPGAGRKPAGEQRPPEQHPAESGKPVFFGIRMVSVAPGADGVLEARPVAGRPGSAATASANAFYMMPSGPGIKPPAAGDVIPVEFR